MISSTRSSESASRSSWKDASSVMSDSSIPSCSVRTSLTRSKTSSRDAAMSPHQRSGVKAGGPSARRSYTRGPLGQTRSEPADDVVVDAARGEADRVRDRGARRVAVRDHGEPAEAEEICAAVGVGVEPVPEPPGSRANQQAAELAARRRGDLGAQRVEDRADRPFERLQDDIAREAVGDDDIGGAAEDVAALGVAGELEVARGEQLVHLERELVPFL